MDAKATALSELLDLFGRGVDATHEVEISGSDPVFPCRFPLGEAAAAVLAACGLAVSDLWELRTGRRQRVGVDVRAAAASLVSFLFVRVRGADAPALGPDARRGNPTTALYRARDGRWVHLHGGFPHLAAGTLRLLECEGERDAIARAVERWDALDLENALADAGMCGAMVRSAEEWGAHPQGRALAPLPLVEVIRIGDAAPVGLPPGDRPLSGIRALDLTRVLAGPACGRTLAEHGAEVLRIGAASLPSVPPFVMDTSHGKRSAHLDLTCADGLARLRELIAGADVFAQGYRSGTLARRGLGPEELATLRPGLIYVSMNCYGHVGPWVGRPGWEQLAQSVTGLARDHGPPDEPRLVPAAACDYTTGYLAALGTLIALRRRAVEGGSWHVRTSLAQTGMWLHRLGTAWSAARGDASEAGPSIEQLVAAGTAALGLTEDEVAKLTTESDTPWGRLTHLAPVVQLSETPAHWSRPSTPLGTHPPEWEQAV